MTDLGAKHYEDYCGGDDSAFELLVDLYKNGLLLFINTFVNNLYDAEDVLGETLFTLAAKKPKYKGRSSFKTWLYAIARNKSLSFLRQRNRFVYVQHSEVLEAVEPSQEINTLEETYLKKEEAIQLHRALEQMRQSYRQVLYLKYIEELSNTDIALVMHKSNRQIENALYRAKAQLSSILAGQPLPKNNGDKR